MDELDEGTALAQWPSLLDDAPSFSPSPIDLSLTFLEDEEEVLLSELPLPAPPPPAPSLVAEEDPLPGNLEAVHAVLRRRRLIKETARLLRPDTLPPVRARVRGRPRRPAWSVAERMAALDRLARLYCHEKCTEQEIRALVARRRWRPDAVEKMWTEEQRRGQGPRRTRNRDTL